MTPVWVQSIRSALKPWLGETKSGRSSLVDVGDMTNQLPYTALDTATLTATVPPPIRTATHTPNDRPQPPHDGRRWMLIACGAALAVAAAVGISIAANNSTESAAPKVEQRPAHLIIQDEIDAALAERDAAADLKVQRPAHLIIQDEIDAALAERDGVSEMQRPTAQIVQDQIDAAVRNNLTGLSPASLAPTDRVTGAKAASPAADLRGTTDGWSTASSR